MQTIKYQVVRDIALDENGDWLIENGDLQLIGDDPAIVQAVTIALQFAMGEWFLNLNAGLPYFANAIVDTPIFGTKNPDPNLLRSLFQDVIAGVPGITEVTSLTLTQPTRRSLSVDWEATSSLSGLTIGNSTTLNLPGATS
jgi:hypothetical protein